MGSRSLPVSQRQWQWRTVQSVVGETLFCLSAVFAKAQHPALGSNVSALPSSHMMSEQMSGLLATADII